jgi:hypothetical protein
MHSPHHKTCAREAIVARFARASRLVSVVSDPAAFELRGSRFDSSSPSLAPAQRSLLGSVGVEWVLTNSASMHMELQPCNAHRRRTLGLASRPSSLLSDPCHKAHFARARSEKTSCTTQHTPTRAGRITCLQSGYGPWHSTPASQVRRCKRAVTLASTVTHPLISSKMSATTLSMITAALAPASEAGVCENAWESNANEQCQ